MSHLVGAGVVGRSVATVVIGHVGPSDGESSGVGEAVGTRTDDGGGDVEEVVIGGVCIRNVLDVAAAASTTRAAAAATVTTSTVIEHGAESIAAGDDNDDYDYDDHVLGGTSTVECRSFGGGGVGDVSGEGLQGDRYDYFLERVTSTAASASTNIPTSTTTFVREGVGAVIQRVAVIHDESDQHHLLSRHGDDLFSKRDQLGEGCRDARADEWNERIVVGSCNTAVIIISTAQGFETQLQYHDGR